MMAMFERVASAEAGCRTRLDGMQSILEEEMAHAGGGMTHERQQQRMQRNQSGPLNQMLALRMQLSQSINGNDSNGISSGIDSNAAGMSLGGSGQPLQASSAAAAAGIHQAKALWQQ